jgi:hypothetical protein
MATHCIVLESFDRYPKRRWERIFETSEAVFVIEPFVVYHAKKGKFIAFPDHFPRYAESFIKSGRIQLLPSHRLNGKTIYREAADMAVESVESAYPIFRKAHKDLIEYVSSVLRTGESEYVFKIHLCEKLAEYYSVNLMFHRIEEALLFDQIEIYPDLNMESYGYLQKLLRRCNREGYSHGRIHVSDLVYKMDRKEVQRRDLLTVIRLAAQTLASGVSEWVLRKPTQTPKEYRYGVSIISPDRQSRENQRGPGFIVDDNKIAATDVAYISTVRLNRGQQEKLTSLLGRIYGPPQIGRFFSNFKDWIGLFRLARKKYLYRDSLSLIDVSCAALFRYFSWLSLLSHLKFKHFITHSDFGIHHVGRNIALSQNGVQTWYYTDSMNLGANMQENADGCRMRHPYWCYLRYDHFVTWNQFIADYFRAHPGSFRETHVVGCLWSGHIDPSRNPSSMIAPPLTDVVEKPYMLAAFDTTYSRNGVCSYEEGLAFGEHVLRLVDEIPDLCILFKEKKAREIHGVFDPERGHLLTALYERMSSHPQIRFFSRESDSSGLIAISAASISFPFTSTTFEAHSANKPAVWHDPMGYYRKTPYARSGIMTHSYEDIKAWILALKSGDQGALASAEPGDRRLLDPYRDGKAIDRFRDLLASS